MNEFTTFARRIGLVGVTNTIISLRGIITLPILTKTLGTSEYGILSQILVTIGLLMSVITLGLGASLVRFLPSKNKKEIVQGIFTTLFIVLLSGLFFSVILFFSSIFFAEAFIKETSAIPAMQIASVLIILQALETLSLNAFRIFGQIKRYSIVVVSKTFLEIVLIASFVLNGYGVIGVIYSLIISESIFLLINLILTISYAGFALPNFSLLRPYLAFGLPIIPIGVFELVVSSTDRYIIGFFQSASSVGIYSAAYNIGILASVVGPYIIFIS
jgi:O-antigen/teichoic acid export membrane protein